MKVRILSGNQAGGVTEVPQVEGEVMVATGYAEPVAADDVPTPATPTEPAPVDPPVVDPPRDPVVSDPPADPPEPPSE